MIWSGEFMFVWVKRCFCATRRVQSSLLNRLILHWSYLDYALGPSRSLWALCVYSFLGTLWAFWAVWQKVVWLSWLLWHRWLIDYVNKKFLLRLWHLLWWETRSRRVHSTRFCSVDWNPFIWSSCAWGCGYSLHEFFFALLCCGFFQDGVLIEVQLSCPAASKAFEIILII